MTDNDKTSTYHLSYIAMMPVQQVGTAELPEDHKTAEQVLASYMDEQYPNGYQVLYFSKDEPLEEDLKVTFDDPAPSLLN